MDKNTRVNREKEKNWLLEHFYKLVIDVSYLSRTRSNRIFGARSIPIISIFINQTNFKSIYFARYLENFGINKKEEVSFNKKITQSQIHRKTRKKIFPRKISWNNRVERSSFTDGNGKEDDVAGRGGKEGRRPLCNFVFLVPGLPARPLNE